MTARYKKVGVFCGGQSGEREISLQTGGAVCAGLQRSDIDAEIVDVGHQEIDFTRYDAAFIALHGRDGEDGKFQAVLEYQGVLYTGSRVEASCLSMNKWHTKALWNSVGIQTPSYRIVRRGDAVDFSGLQYPLYVKPVNEGSSIGITCVTEESDLASAIKLAEQYDEWILLEQEVIGDEYTFSYVEGVDDLPLIQLKVRSGFYDYDAKYLRDDTQYLVAPDIVDELSHSYKRQAYRAFDVLGMTGWGRVDFIVDVDGQAWFIEANSVPGMTSHSLVPMAANHVGVNFDQLCVRILETANYGK